VQKRRCAKTEEGSRKRKGTRSGKKGKADEEEQEEEGTELSRVYAELRRLSKLVKAMGVELGRVSWGYTKARRELRGFRDLLDEDWEMESETEESEGGSEEGEEARKELKSLRKMGEIEVGEGWKAKRTQKSLKMGKFADNSGISESDDGEDEEDSGNEEKKKIDKGKKKAEETEMEPEGPGSEEEEEDDDDDDDEGGEEE
jgi:hypothetical protein